MFKKPRRQFPLLARLKLSVGSMQRRGLILEPAAKEKIQDPINIEVTISYVLPEALA